MWMKTHHKTTFIFMTQGRMSKQRQINCLHIGIPAKTAKSTQVWKRTESSALTDFSKGAS